jgi:hypothetical protein
MVNAMKEIIFCPEHDKQNTIAEIIENGGAACYCGKEVFDTIKILFVDCSGETIIETDMSYYKNNDKKEYKEKLFDIVSTCHLEHKDEIELQNYLEIEKNK